MPILSDRQHLIHAAIQHAIDYAHVTTANSDTSDWVSVVL